MHGRNHRLECLHSHRQLMLGAAVAYIALKQWKTAQQQAKTAETTLRAELFDRRYAKYQELVALVIAILHDTAEAYTTIEIQRLRKELSWLLGEDASSWIRENIERVSGDLWVVRQHLKSVAFGLQEHDDLVQQQHDLQMSLSQNLDELARILTPQMAIGR